jgi:hypothetical protein
VCRLKHVEELRNIGIINSTTQLHLVGSFCGFESIGFSKYTVKRVASYIARKHLKLWQHKVRAVQKLFPPDWEVRRSYCRWLQHSVNNRFIGSRMTFHILKFVHQVGHWLRLPLKLHSLRTYEIYAVIDA